MLFVIPKAPIKLSVEVAVRVLSVIPKAPRRLLVRAVAGSVLMPKAPRRRSVRVVVRDDRLDRTWVGFDRGFGRVPFLDIILQ